MRVLREYTSFFTRNRSYMPPRHGVAEMIHAYAGAPYTYAPPAARAMDIFFLTDLQGASRSRPHEFIELDVSVIAGEARELLTAQPEPGPQFWRLVSGAEGRTRDLASTNALSCAASSHLPRGASRLMSPPRSPRSPRSAHDSYTAPSITSPSSSTPRENSYEPYLSTSADSASLPLTPHERWRERAHSATASLDGEPIGNGDSDSEFFAALPVSPPRTMSTAAGTPVPGTPKMPMSIGPLPARSHARCEGASASLSLPGASGRLLHSGASTPREPSSVRWHSNAGGQSSMLTSSLVVTAPTARTTSALPEPASAADLQRSLDARRESRGAQLSAAQLAPEAQTSHRTMSGASSGLSATLPCPPKATPDLASRHHEDKAHESEAAAADRKGAELPGLSPTEDGSIPDVRVTLDSPARPPRRGCVGRRAAALTSPPCSELPVQDAAAVAKGSPHKERAQPAREAAHTRCFSGKATGGAKGSGKKKRAPPVTKAKPIAIVPDPRFAVQPQPQPQPQPQRQRSRNRSHSRGLDCVQYSSASALQAVTPASVR
jgi:hypothetical protein